MELISFKQGMILDTTELYNMIPVRMILTFTQDQKVTGKLELILFNHSTLKWHDETQMLAMVDYVKETILKKSRKSREYGFFGKFLLLLFEREHFVTNFTKHFNVSCLRSVVNRFATNLLSFI